MCVVAWCSLSWEAVATFLTGITAVAGAVWVGTRHANIFQKQTEISAKQVEIEKLKLSIELFDRRWAVYETTSKWFKSFLQNGAVDEGPLRQEFVDAIHKAEFLFRAEVSTKLREWFDWGVAHAAHRRAGRIDSEREMSNRLIAASNEMNQVFADEMTLSG